MNIKPKVSVLMPAYNASKYVEESIQSILRQTYTDFELLVLDDGSTDDTRERIQACAQQDSRVLFYKNEKNLGISPSRNKLLQLAQGEFIVWQDADDISLPERIEHQVEFMQRESDVGICGGFLEFFHEADVSGCREYAAIDKELRKNVFRYSPVSQGASIIRKSVLLKVGGIDETLSQAEDLDMSLRIGMISKFANLQEVVLRYRQSGQSISSKKLKDNIKQTLIVRRRAQKLYGYKMTFGDTLTFLITYIFQFLPSRVTIFVFNLLRNN